MKTEHVTGHECPLGDDLLLRFLDRTLPPAEQHRLHRVLTQCDECLAAFRRVREETLRATPPRFASDFADPASPEWWSTLPRWAYDENSAAASNTDGSPLQTITISSTLAWRRDIDRGGNGQVRLYYERSLGREVAVKFVPTDALHQMQQRQFGRECCITGNLDHPNVPPIYSVGAVQASAGGNLAAGDSVPLPALAMRYIRGSTLAEVIRTWHDQTRPWSRQQRRIMIRDLLGSLQTVCRTVDFAHRCGVAHYDLKPSNILVHEGTTYVIDWGLARLYRTEWAKSDQPTSEANGRPQLLWDRIPEDLRSTTGVGGGTPPYMAPEQARADGSVDGRHTDIYLLGAILFEMLTGRRPFQPRTGEDSDSFLRRVANRRERPDLVAGGRRIPAGRPWDQLSPGEIPAELAAICDKAMRYDPLDRYASAGAMATDLEDYLEGRPVEAHVYGRREQWALTVRRHTSAMIVGLAGVLLLLMFTGFASAFLYQAWASETSARKTADSETENARKAEANAKQSEAIAQGRKQLAERLKLAIAAKSVERNLALGDHQGAEILHDAPPTWEIRYLRSKALGTATRRSSVSLATWGVLALALNSDQKRLLSADAAGVLTLWDLPTAKVLRQWGKERVAQEYQLPLHHFQARDSKQSLESWGPCATDVAWLDDENRFVVASSDGAGLIRNADDDQARTLVKHPRALVAVAANSDGLVLFGAADGRVILRSARDDTAQDRLLGDSPITDVAWNSRTQHWLVSDETGGVFTLAAKDLVEVTTLKLTGPASSLDVAPRATGSELAVATPAGIQLYLWQAEPPQWTHSGVCKFPTEAPDRSLQQVHLGNDGEYVFGLASDGTLAAWRHQERKLAWTAKVITVDSRRVELVRRAQAASTPMSIPSVFQRVGAGILGLADPRQVLVAGDDGVASVWDLPPRTGMRVDRLSDSMGASPQLAFDEAGSGRLWSLDRQGTLSVVDAETGKVLQRHPKAHSGGQAGIAAIPKSGEVLTVGGDDVIRSWRWEKGAIVMSREPIKNDHPLMAITISHDGRLVATMDVRSNLCVWQREPGKLLYRDPLSRGTDEPPLTGKLAFNRDTTRLAVFGPGQSGYVYVVRPDPWNFRRIPDQLWVAGPGGGTALVWNPINVHAILNADDHPRLHSRMFGVAESEQEFFYEAGDSVTVALAATRDGERIISLEKSGKLSFHDSRWQIKTLELRSGLENLADLAVDPRDRWLAVSNEAGEIEIWDAGPTGSTSTSDELTPPETAWRPVDILERTSARARVVLRGAQLDSRGRLCLLAGFSVAGDLRDDCELRFLRQVGSDVVSEPLVPAGAEFARRMDPNAASLVLDRDDRPIVALRCRTADKTTYDGKLFLARRGEDGDWQYETVHEHGNWGFYPHVALGDDQRAAWVVHFTFATSHLLVSGRSATPPWSPRIVGRLGDGINFMWRKDSEGRIHGVGRVNRFGSDAALRVYMLLDANGKLVRREILPFAVADIEMLQLSPDGTPVVLESHFAPALRRKVLHTYRRTEQGWRESQLLPIAPLAWNIAPDGALQLLDYDRTTQRLALLTSRGERWERTYIGPLRSHAGESLIMYQRDGRPAILVSSEFMPFGWCQLWRAAR